MNQKASVKDITTVVGMLCFIFIGILVFYNIAVSIDTNDIDANIGNTWTVEAQNATNSTMDQAATFFTIAPIIAIVVVAVVILRYVGMI